MNGKVVLQVGAALAAVLGILAAPAEAAGVGKHRKLVTASADIRDCSSGELLGAARLIERPSSEGVKQVQVLLRVRGLSPGKHAVHIHETGECEPCGAAGGHFDPGPFGFSSPDGNHPYHSGDLVNIRVRPSGVGVLYTSTTRVTLSEGPLSLFDADGSAFIVHDFEDTYCPDGAVPGCAGGSRAACGIIELN